MTTKNMTPRTIILSEETAELFAAKKALDECFYTVNRVHDKQFGHDREFESKFYDAFAEMNNVIVDLLTEQIDTNSTESDYKVI